MGKKDRNKSISKEFDLHIDGEKIEVKASVGNEEIKARAKGAYEFEDGNGSLDLNLDTHLGTPSFKHEGGRNFIYYKFPKIYKKLAVVVGAAAGFLSTYSMNFLDDNLYKIPVSLAASAVLAIAAKKSIDYIESKPVMEIF